MFFRRKTATPSADSKPQAVTVPANPGRQSVAAIIFSKDRALQLDAVLRSFNLHCIEAAETPVKVLYAASASQHEQFYKQLATEHPRVEFARETRFRMDLARLTDGFDHVLLLVDDNIFVRQFSLREAVCHLEQNPDVLGFSLRLGKNTTYCYPLSAQQKLPSFAPVGNAVLSYDWTQAEHDFNFPLEVSSSIYRVPQFLPEVVANELVSNPNLLESKMHDLRDRFKTTHPRLLCFENSVTFCNPVNVVQNVSANRHSADLEMSAVRLAERFALGYRIDVAAFQGMMPNGCHQEVRFKFLPPQQKLGRIEASLSLARDGSTWSPTSAVDTGKLNEEELLVVLRLLAALNEVRSSGAQDWLLKLSQVLETDRRALAQEFARTLPRMYNRLGELEGAVAWFKDQAGRWEQTAMQFKRDAEYLKAEHDKLKQQIEQANQSGGKAN